MPDLDANTAFEAWSSQDESITETRDQEVARLIAPRGRTPDQVDADEVFSIYASSLDNSGGLGSFGRSSSQSMGASSRSLVPGTGLFGTAPNRSSKRASHKVISAFEDDATFAASTKNLTWEPPQRSAPYIDKVREVEATHAMPENLMAALVTQESSWDPRAKSSAGARGLTQLMPVHNVDTDDTDASIEYGAEYLSGLKDQFGTWELALAAYNWGPGNLEKKGIEKAPKETRDYIKNIMGKVHMENQPG